LCVTRWTGCTPEACRYGIGSGQAGTPGSADRDTVRVSGGSADRDTVRVSGGSVGIGDEI